METELKNHLPSVSFRGCSWLMIYNLGVLEALRETPQISEWRFAGASSGAVTATIAAAGIETEDASDWLIRMAEEGARRRFGPVGRMTHYVQGGLDHLLPNDAHTRVNGKLRISITRLRGMESWIVDEYESKQELIEAVLASCYIPIYYERPARFRGQLCIDGGLTENCPRYDSQTLTVSPQPGPFDIYPNLQTPRRFHYFPPGRDRLQRLFQIGYESAKAAPTLQRLFAPSSVSWTQDLP